MNTLNSDPLIDKINPVELTDKKKRVILTGDSLQRKKHNKFPNNKITTTKYISIILIPQI